MHSLQLYLLMRLWMRVIGSIQTVPISVGGCLIHHSSASGLLEVETLLF